MTASLRRRPPRVGVLGGTFDPPHIGHLALAEQARVALGLERVLFVPAADPPHKRSRAKSAFAHRLAMTRLAVRGLPGFAASDLEGRRPGPSFTVDTLRALRARQPKAELWLLLGEDNLRGFSRWREPREIASLARIAVAPRPNRSRRARRPGVARAAGRRVTWLPGPVLDVSSSALRAAARRGGSLRVLVPPAVAAYAMRHRLYRRSGA